MDYYFRMLALTALLLMPPYALLRFFWRRTAHKKGRPAGSPLREVLLGAFALFMAGLLVLVLTPRPGLGTAWQRVLTGEEINLVPGRTLRGFFAGSWNTGFAVNIIGNVAVFVPFGLCLPLFWQRWRPFWKMALAAVLLPVCIETAQLFIGRSVDVDDVILNAAGVLLGYGLCRLLLLAKPLDRLCLPVAEA